MIQNSQNFCPHSKSKINTASEKRTNEMIKGPKKRNINLRRQIGQFLSLPLNDIEEKYEPKAKK